MDGILIMRLNKRLIGITACVSMITVVVIIFDNNKADIKSVAYDICLACFGSALLGLVMAIVQYGSERRASMEKFWHEGVTISNKIGKIEYLDLGDASELVKQTVIEERKSNAFEPKPTKAKEALKTWIECNLVSDDGETDFEEKVECYYQDMVDKCKRNLFICAKSYMEFSYVDIYDLQNAYSQFDFLFGNRRIRKLAYNEIYKKIVEFHSECGKNRIHLMKLIDGSGNVKSCVNIIAAWNEKLFTIKDKEVYASFADDLNDKLEFFRSKIYHGKAEAIDPVPINYTKEFGEEPRNKRKNEDVILEDTRRKLL